MQSLLQVLISWIATHGYPVLAGLLALGILGLPVPDETFLTFSGFLCNQGRMNLALTMLVGGAGGCAGATLSYGIGRVGGTRLVDWLSRRSSHVAHSARRARELLEGRGRWALPFMYFIPGVRHVAFLVAGSLRFRYRTFATLAYPGGAVWAASFVLTGYFFGKSWMDVSTRTHRIILIALAVLAGLVLVWFVGRRIQRHLHRRRQV